MDVPYLLMLLGEFQGQISTPRLHSIRRTSRKTYSERDVKSAIQICSPMQDIQHWWRNKTDEEVIDLPSDEISWEIPNWTRYL